MATDYEGACDAILTRFKAQMDSLRPTLKIAWENMPFDPQHDFSPSTDVAWARISVIGGEAFQASLGGGAAVLWRHPGLVAVQIFTPADGGANTALAIADDVATALRGVTTSGVVLKAASIQPVGRDGAFYQVNVTVPFRFDAQ
jgi:hypothetical protein